MSRTDRRSLALLSVLLLTLTLPFVRRAFFVDDFYFVTMAKGILEHPTRPYDFLSDDAGLANIAWERGQQPRMVNPPLFHYFLAAVIKIWGSEVWKLRTASLIFPLLSLFCVYFLGKRFVKQPIIAAGLLAITPAFWLTSYSLLIDSALLAFMLAALESFIRGQERQSLPLWLLSGLLIGATLMTKYTGFLIIPVLLVWHALHPKQCSIKGTAIVLAVGAALFALWGVWGILTYGQPHFTATLSRGFHPATSIGLWCLALFILGGFLRWRSGSNRATWIGAWTAWGFCFLLIAVALVRTGSLAVWIQMLYLDKVIGVASFLGGTTVFLFFAPVLLAKENRLAFAALALSMIFLFICFSSRIGGFDAAQSLTLTFFIASTAAFLMLLGMKVRPGAQPAELFLALWILIGLIEQVVVMPWTAGRYLLIMLPPICWFFQIWMESWRTLRPLAFGTTFLFGLALAYVDYAQAGVIVPLSNVLQSQQALFQSIAPRPPHHWYYLADTFDGSQPYVLNSGWENVFPHQQFEKGSLFLRSYYRKSSWWNVSDPNRFQSVMVWDYANWLPLRVMDVPASAGFYASAWGILPYAFTRHPLERFELYLVR